MAVHHGDRRYYSELNPIPPQPAAAQEPVSHTTSEAEQHYQEAERLFREAERQHRKTEKLHRSYSNYQDISGADLEATHHGEDVVVYADPIVHHPF